MNDLDLAVKYCDSLVHDLSTRYSGLNSRGKNLVRALLTNYTDARRVYHNWDHIWFGWKHLSNYKYDDQFNLNIAKWAWLWHDVISDSEKLSADAACLVADIFEMSGTSRIRDLILITDHTRSLGVQGDSFFKDYIRDLDLAILGSPPERFKFYRNQIWQEWLGRCTAEEFRKGSSKWAECMLSAKQLFWTQDFLSLEEQARKNLATLLE